MSNSVKKLAIVTIIMGIFKIGEEGKLTNFFSRIISTLNREITNFKHNIDGEKLRLKSELQKLNDKLEDAKVALTSVYTDIDYSQLKTNDTQEKYMEVYLDALGAAESEVTRLEALIEFAKESSKKIIDSDKDQIKKRELRITTIQDFK